jgi:hypothetical protein
MRRTLGYLVSAALLAAGVAGAALALSGCAGAGAGTVSAAWPEAEAERTYDRPVEFIRWPLTGELAPDFESTQVRVVSVKIENSPESRPQTGLHQADVVYETLTEGNITRFNAMFHSQSPDWIGPIRSARLSDSYILPQYDPIFAHVGGQSQVMSRVRAAGVDDLDEFANGGAYHRTSDRPRPHNVYTSLEELREAAIDRGYEATQSTQPLQFELMSDVASATIVQLTVPFGNGNTVTWDFDAEDNAYVRTQAGTVQKDRETGTLLTARNVVVLWAQQSSTSMRDATGARALDIVLSGTGRASIFRDGQRYDGMWTAEAGAPPRFATDEGEPILLGIGNTWFEVVPSSTNISMR